MIPSSVHKLLFVILRRLRQKAPPQPSTIFPDYFNPQRYSATGMFLPGIIRFSSMPFATSTANLPGEDWSSLCALEMPYHSFN